MKVGTSALVLALSIGVVVVAVSACVVPVPPPPPAPHPLKIAYFGDSVAMTYAYGGLASNASSAGDIVLSGGSMRLGCAVGRYTMYDAGYWGPGGSYNVLCDWSQDVTSGDSSFRGYQTVVAAQRPDLAMLDFCGWDLIPRRIPLGDGTWDPLYRSLGDPVYDQFLLGELSTMTDHLMSAGARAVIVHTCGTPLDLATGQPRQYAPELAKWNDLLRSFAASDPDAELLDLGPWIDAQPDPFFWRDDGQHWSTEGGRRAADEWANPQLFAIGSRLWPA